MLPKTSAYIKSYDRQTKRMYFLIKDDNVLEKYNTIWDKVITDIWKDFHSEPVYNKFFLKTKINCYDNEVFYHKKIPMLDSNHTCWAVISLDSALKKDENYYPQAFLKSVNILRIKWLDIFIIIWVIFLLMMMSLMKNKSELACA